MCNLSILVVSGFVFFGPVSRYDEDMCVFSLEIEKSLFAMS